MKMIDVLNSISSYFHVSAMRLNALNEISNKKKIKCMELPHFFEIRWVEYTYRLFNAVLTSWNALILYFEKQPDARNFGFRNYLTNLNNLKRIAFLDDLLRIFKHFQKKIQSNSLTLPSFCEEVRILRKNLLDFKEKTLPGGFESALNDEILIENNQANLKELI